MTDAKRLADEQFDGLTTDELCTLMIECSQSPEQSDQAFAAACREEIKRRKPEKEAK